MKRRGVWRIPETPRADQPARVSRARGWTRSRRESSGFARPAISIRLGLNFGPNSITPPEGIAADYAALMERLGPLADFIVINVSSPNTPGLRNWQSPEKMARAFRRECWEKAGESPRPVLVKISPDLERNELFRICETALELGVDGIVACNTTHRARGGRRLVAASGRTQRPSAC